MQQKPELPPTGIFPHPLCFCIPPWRQAVCWILTLLIPAAAKKLQKEQWHEWSMKGHLLKACYLKDGLWPWPQSASLHWLYRSFKKIAQTRQSARQKWISSAVIKCISYLIWSTQLCPSQWQSPTIFSGSKSSLVYLQTVLSDEDTCTKEAKILFLLLWSDTFRSIVGISNLLRVWIKTPVTEIYLVLYPNRSEYEWEVFRKTCLEVPLKHRKIHSCIAW